MRNATLLLLSGIAAVALFSSPDAHAKKVRHANDCYTYAKTLKVGAPKANPRDRIRQRVYETDHSCNPKQDMTWFKDKHGTPLERRKGTSWLPK